MNNKLDLSVNIAGVTLKNPVMTASGTFSEKEFADYMDLSELGAVVVKGVANNPWKGNSTPRIAETYGGMLNSVGLQNQGVDFFIKEELPFLKKYDTKIIVNIAGRTVEDYCEVAEKLNDTQIDMIELNISCPNVKKGGAAFGTDSKMAEHVTKEVRKYCTKPLIVKLSPNVTDITEIARAVEAGGADVVSLINTLLGMKIDIHKRKFVLANKMGGFSGPAIKPVAVRMVYQTAKIIKIPIIGIGGISTGEDAVEFMLAGAKAVAVGTASLINPTATLDVINGIKEYMLKYKISNINDLGAIK